MKITIKNESAQLSGVKVNGTTTSYTMKKVLLSTMTPAQRTQYEFTQRQFNRVK